MRITKAQLKADVESFNAALPASSNIGLVLIHQNGGYTLYKATMENGEIREQHHLVSGNAREISYALDGFRFCERYFWNV